MRYFIATLRVLFEGTLIKAKNTVLPTRSTNAFDFSGAFPSITLAVLPEICGPFNSAEEGHRFHDGVQAITQLYVVCVIMELIQLASLSYE